jgi:hypothetical protein
MAGTFPTQPGFATTNFQIVNPAQTSQTFGGKMRRAGMGTSFYTFTASFPPMTRPQAAPIIGFLSAQYGQLESFQILLPEESYPRANYTGATPRVGLQALPGVKQVTVSNVSPNQTILRSGDFFKFQSHSKVYMAIADCTADAGGVATLNFAGSLVRGVSVNDSIIVTAVPFTVVLNNQIQEYEVGLDRTYRLEVDMREVW